LRVSLIFIVTISIVAQMISVARAGEKPSAPLLSTDPVRFALIEESFEQTDSLISAEKEKKSIFRAALYSAVIPGTGQFYGGSTWKAILFAGIEVASWTAYFVYTGKGDNEENQVKTFADTHWSEKKYWSKLYDEAKMQGIDVPEYNTNSDKILTDYNQEVVESLRFLEEALRYSHKLPETKTQQYYEMIYKYLIQFGNGWDDANFDVKYYGNTNNLTPNMFTYRDMRNTMNDYYDAATIATNIVLINHVLSALDAAWTTSKYNRQITMKIRAHNKRYFDENVQMFGVTLTW
jgi:hypothetical protein